MHDDTAPHHIIPAVEIEIDRRVDELLERSRLATAIGAGLLAAAVILGAVAIDRVWPPPAISDQAPRHS